MPRQRRLGYESLETRQMLSASSPMSHFVASQLAEETASQLTDSPYEAGPVTDAEWSMRDLLSSTLGSRWDWLDGTEWYVPVENLLAYTSLDGLSNPQPIGDQTIWHIESSAGGQIAGTATVKLSISSDPSETPFIGTVTAGGQIRIEFIVQSGSQPISGLGRMRYQQGSWYMQMQMESSLFTHWAFMAPSEEGATPPDPSEFSPDPDLQSTEWQWLAGTQWAIRDTELFGASQSGVFEIDDFNNGYFWGSGTSAQPFNVLGSVTPQGNLLLLVSVNGATPEARAGQLFGNAMSGTLVFHSYEGDPASGTAWSLSGV